MTLEGGGDTATVVVTGAAGGIGAGLAKGLAADGWGVAVLDIDATGGARVVDEIVAAGGRAELFGADMSDDASLLEAAAAVRAAMGPVTSLVNNAGWDIIQPFEASTTEFRSRVLEVNLRGAMTLTHALLDDLKEAQGRVVNISSDAGRVGSSGETTYASAKAGLIGFTKSLARELARHQVTVNCVAPGPTDTPLFYKNPEKLQAALIRSIPLRRLAHPDDILHAVRFFVDPAASYTTGQILSVSGGLTMHG